MTRFGLEARRDELLEMLDVPDGESEDLTASAVIFFGGQPVVGTRGIESDFAGEAVSRFQDLVAKVMATDLGVLSERGVVPNKRAAALHITNITRGSFGFVLEEVEPRELPMESVLKSALVEATQLLDAFGQPGDAQYEHVLETADPRVLGTLGTFFELMRKRRATLRLVANEIECKLGTDAISRAAERAKSATTKSTQESIRGQLTGVLPEARRFEFEIENMGNMISGRFSGSFSENDLIEFSQEWIGIDVEAQMTVRRVYRKESLIRQSYVLTNLQEWSDEL